MILYCTRGQVRMNTFYQNEAIKLYIRVNSIRFMMGFCLIWLTPVSKTGSCFGHFW